MREIGKKQEEIYLIENKIWIFLRLSIFPAYHDTWYSSFIKTSGWLMMDSEQYFSPRSFIKINNFIVYCFCFSPIHELVKYRVYNMHPTAAFSISFGFTMCSAVLHISFTIRISEAKFRYREVRQFIRRIFPDFICFFINVFEN